MGTITDYGVWRCLILRQLLQEMVKNSIFFGRKNAKNARFL
jgi:hypothetical protein